MKIIFHPLAIYIESKNDFGALILIVFISGCTVIGAFSQNIISKIGRHSNFAISHEVNYYYYYFLN